jgi:transcriptional regulator with XRE-family HTH domain
MDMKPTKEQVKEARLKAGLTQKQAAEVLKIQNDSHWRRWELGGSNMSENDYELFLLLTDQHPVYRLAKRRNTQKGE